MRHLKSGRKLKRTASHRKALLNNMAMSLFEHKRIKTTEAKAKELRPFAEQLITRAKNALLNEQQGNLPTGQTVDIHNRRQVARFITQKKTLEHLFTEIAPVIVNRNGGYLRITKLGQRRGDGGNVAIIEFVDYSKPQDGVASRARRKKSTSTVVAKPVQVVSPPLEQAAPVVEEVVAVTEEVNEQVVAESSDVEVSSEVAEQQDNADAGESAQSSNDEASQNNEEENKA
ncbi:MAG TPA: 50S ribosomal protein L17 [Candidatus Kapabacteria bacterium]|jgi:large subunit ribosomal protein L17|nr:50S ribosomal protein L17 [Candidatus Kapabacteria bacterium]HRK58593.1 50S ribosomal protein L17 [Candidatus Kapabacteria bacterium]